MAKPKGATGVRQEFPGRHCEEIEASHLSRQRQFDQISSYLKALQSDSARKRKAFFAPDHSGKQAYDRSIRKYRRALCARLGYPPPEPKLGAKAQYELVATDFYSTIYRMWYEVSEGVEVYALLFVPRKVDGPRPLMICQHGGGGNPELISAFRKDGPGNYGWMVQRSLQEGFVAWVPALIFPYGGSEDISGPTRADLDASAKYVGTSILAIELWKILRGLDQVLKRKEVDPGRVAMMGLSYGGLYTQYAAALDKRIAVAVSSCFFNDRALYPHADWCFFNHLNVLTDPEICALICPRALMIEVGRQDQHFSVEGARSQVKDVAVHWRKLGIPEKFVYTEFEGGHEFRGRRAFQFVKRHLAG